MASENKKNIFFIFKKFKKNKKDNLLENVEVSSDSVSSDSFVKENLSESDILATKAAEDAIMQKKIKKVKLIRRIIIFIFIIFGLVFIIILYNNNKKKQEETAEVMTKVQQVRVMNISSELSGSGTLSPKDSYTITSLVEGNITNVYFEVGDRVEKDQLLLTIESSSAQRDITTASSSLAQAKDNYNQAKYNYEKVLEDYSNNTFKSPYTGYLRTLNVKAGDTIGNNSELGSIIDDSIMTIKLPFIATEVNEVKNGDLAFLTLQETGEYLIGEVFSIANEQQVINNGALVRYVTIKVKNPGGLTTDHTAMAAVGNALSVQDASFEVDTNQKITFTDGNNVDIEAMIVEEGAYVKKGDPIFKISENTIMNVISSKKNSYLSAKDSLTKAETNIENAIDNLDQYYIKAPIAGTIITKNAKVGDKVQRTSSNATTLAVIYDLSELKFDMDVDELDISKVELGQTVNIQADAFNNKKFEGSITNISLQSSNSNGVTNYPVTVTISDVDSLLPGMNVDAYVVLSKADNALVIPSNGLQRGNVVYVLNTSETIKNNNYSDEGISDRIKNRVPDGFTAVNVTTGISNENYIQILEGLVEGDQIYVPESTSNNNSWGGFGVGMGAPPGGGAGGMRR